MILYLDFISPYAYVGWHQAKRLAARHGRPLEPVPILFAALLDANGQKGPAEIPSKRIYTFKDAYRKAHKEGLVLRPPPSHPFNPLVALRVASLPMDEAERVTLIDRLFDAAWRDGTGVEKPEQVAAIAGAERVAEAGTAEAKERVRARTAEALSRGVFGVPSLVVDGEVFWGTDGLDFADAFLRGEDPVPKDLAWAERPASAIRKGSVR